MSEIKSRDAKIIKLHSKINQLSYELELAKERVHLVHNENERLKTQTVPLSVVEEVLNETFGRVEATGDVIREINKKAGL